ncbi:MAG TPA: efflux RND transporter periplasmic adaptor subunit [Bryobacteraceae bacterium]|jgi:RND family efflux transporter MFP subunit|nr:efflux RND transporter periplasmic adaptor subunit [Bryobacteraceae bacterium]
MRRTEPDQPGMSDLLRENEDLKRQIQELKTTGNGASPGGLAAKVWRPSAITIWVIFLTAVVLVIVAFVSGYVPLRKRRDLIVGEAREQERALQRVEVIEVGRSSDKSVIELPGSIQAITEAPVLARADGYLQRRMVDIGDRVRTGQALAEIDAPEMDEQIRQVKANLQQSQAAVDQAAANYERGQADEDLAKVTAQRWSSLSAKGVVSRQENDRYQSEYRSLTAATKALEKALAAQRSNVAASEANVARLDQVQSYRLVKAPFDGVITLRNVDVGALVNAGNTLLFRIAQINTLRTYLNVPQANASEVRAGQTARLSVSNLPGRLFVGEVARTASALDPASRTLLVEVRVPNPGGALLPGMYARVALIGARSNAPLRVPSDALIVRGEGTEVAVVRDGHTVHLQKIEVGRDYGDHLEVVGGLSEGQTIIANPGDVVREGLQVQPVLIAR